MFAEEIITISTNVCLFLAGGKTRPDKKKKQQKLMKAIIPPSLPSIVRAVTEMLIKLLIF